MCRVFAKFGARQFGARQARRQPTSTPGLIHLSKAVDVESVGGPKEIADVMEEILASRACDGFVVAATHVPGAYADFVTRVVPELQRRGLYQKDYKGMTLRENLGLPRPPVGAWKDSQTATGWT